MKNTIERVSELSPLKRAYLALEQMEAQLSAMKLTQTEPIAIIGMGCRFPGGANNPEALWQLLRNGVDAITEIPADRWSMDNFYDPDPQKPGKSYARWGGFVQDVDKFDNEFFRLSPREVITLDPQQRLLLEVCWEALEHAGQVAADLVGTRTGVFMGISTADYSVLQLKLGDVSDIDIYSGSGQGWCFAAGRLSYVLGLQGPSLSLDTACSSSLVTIHLACQALRSRECSLALAGGVNLMLSPEPTIYFSRIRALAADGRCKTFDAAADGYVRGEGCGMLVLKRLSDAAADGDNILALIRGSAVNHDGASGGITVPNGLAQQAVISQALENAGVAAPEVNYVEAHGTGTPLGDPIEVRALASILGPQRPRSEPLAIGSIKTNIGHLEAASGVAGVMKVVLSLLHEEIPPHLHLKKPSPHVSWDQLPVTVPTTITSWPAGERRRIAGVSSFGISGTNAHIVLDEAQQLPVLEEQPEVAGEAAAEQTYLLPVSARNSAALQDLAGAYREFLLSEDGSQNSFLRDVCYTAGVRRTHHENRLALVAHSRQELVEHLDAFLRGEPGRGIATGATAPGPQSKLAFIFSGQGSQWLGMGRQLLRDEAVFRTTVEQCDEILRQHVNWSLVEGLKSDEFRLDDTEIAQPAIFALQVGLAGLWRSWGILPDAVVGHSLGEIAAAHVAGVINLEDAIRLVFHRGRLMQEATGKGKMVAVELTLEEAEQILRGHETQVSVAASNGPGSTVLSGAADALEQVVQSLQERNVRCRFLPVNYAFHSYQMAAAQLELVRALEGLTVQPSNVPFFSTVTGEVCEGTALDAEYWGRNVRNPVRFAAATSSLIASQHGLFLEVGPHPVLLTAIKETLQHLGKEGVVLSSLQRERNERSTLFESLGKLYAVGQSVSWANLYPTRGKSLHLPTYPWQRQRFWFLDRLNENGHGNRQARAIGPAGQPTGHPLLGRRLSASPGEIIWETELSISAFPYLNDHRIQGTALVPAAFFAEIALAAAAAHFKDLYHIALKEVRLLKALPLKSGSTQTLRILLTPEADNEAGFQILSQVSIAGQSNASWALHVTGKLQRSEQANDSVASEAETLSDFRARCVDEFAGSQFYLKLEQMGFQYGPAFQVIERGWRRDSEAIGELSIPQVIASQLASYHLHPVLLDACFHLLAAAVPRELIFGNQSSLFLPIGLNHLRVFRRPGSRLWGRASYGTGVNSSAEVIEGDIQLLDETGKVVAEAVGLRLQRVSYRAEVNTSGNSDDWLYEVQWALKVLAGPAPADSASESAAAGSWLIFADRGGLGQAMSDLFLMCGGECVLVFPGESFEQTYQDDKRTEFTVNPARAEEMEQLHKRISRPDGPDFKGIIHLWSLDAEQPEATAADGWAAAQGLGCGSVLHLVQSLVKTNRTVAPRIWLVTAGAQPVNEAQVISVAQAPLWGLGRVLASEHPEFRCSLVDLSPTFIAEEVLSLFNHCIAGDDENQIALRDQMRYVARLVPRRLEAPPDSRTTVTEQQSESQHFDSAVTGSAKLKVTELGNLDSLRLEPVARIIPGAGEVEIKVCAAGLNFRDIMKCLGIYPSAPNEPLRLGDECAGIVVACGDGVEGLKIGDEVIATSVASFGTTTITPAPFVVPKPARLTFQEAATIPVAFMTAYHALHNLAKLSRGERVLIHAGAGGVGQAAVQIAQWLGAEIYATAGSDEKREYLRSLGVSNVMDTRSLAFAEQIMTMTGGQGVDVVLNSLSGEAIPKSLSVLGTFGRFLEIGKRDIYEDARLGLRPFSKNLSFYAIDMELLFRERPRFAAELLREVLQRFEEGVFRPLPLRAFPIAEAVGAFRYMAQRKNIGKVVISFADAAAPGTIPDRASTPAVEVPSAVPQISEKQPVASPSFVADATYLITGGLGALGLLVARWMIAQGARDLVLLGRHEPTEQAREIVQEMEKAGVRITIAQGDVSSEPDVVRVIAEIDAIGKPLRGIVHAAGVLADSLLVNLDLERFNSVTRPKIDGAWHLHRLTVDRSLDFFVLFSSVASILGSPGQANYAAANAFLDSLTHFRRALGLPALTVNWGPWAEVGMAAKSEQNSRFARLGFDSIAPNEGLKVLGQLLGSKAGQVLVMPVNWERAAQSYQALRQSPLFAALRGNNKDQAPETNVQKRGYHEILTKIFAAPPEQRESILEGFFQAQLGRIMGLKPSQIDPQQPLSKLGFDSLVGLELMLSIEAGLGVSLPMENLEHDTNIAKLAIMMLPLLKEPATVAPPTNGAGSQRDFEPAIAPRSSGPVEFGERPPPTVVWSPATTVAVTTESVAQRNGYERSPLDLTAYESHVRPHYAQLLEALKLDKTYIWASGNRMAFDQNGQRIEVLDMVGGFGSTLFGHNHPELVACAQNILAAQTPIHTQGSVRSAAGTLAKQLSEKLKIDTGRDHMCVFANSGAEVIEAAIKHTALEYINRAKEQTTSDERSFALLSHKHRNDPGPLSRILVQRLRKLLKTKAPSDLNTIQRELLAFNQRVYEVSPLFLAVERSFHGKTLGALSLTYSSLYRGSFSDDRGLRVTWIKPGDVAGLSAAIAAELRSIYALSENDDGQLELIERRWCNVAAMFVEPVQGEGGIHVQERDFYAAIQALAQEHDFPLVLDEIQSGMGRCGSFMAAHRLNLQGDYYALAKSLGGGLTKIGALLIDRSRYQPEFGILHTSTFAEDDFSSLVALKALEVFDRDDLATRCATSGEYFIDKLRELQSRYPTVIKEVRGLGLMIGVELGSQADSASHLIRSASRQQTLAVIAVGYLLNEERIRAGIALSSPSTIRLEPSAYITRQEIDQVLQALERLCQIVERANAGRLVRYLADMETTGTQEPVKDWRASFVPVPSEEPAENEPRVAFFGHLIDEAHLIQLEPSLAEVPATNYRTFLRRVHRLVGPSVTRRARIRSANGESVNLSIVSWLATSSLIEEAFRKGETDWLLEQVEEAIQEAQQEGCQVIGLGGYLSIVTQNCKRVATNGVALTTGNSFTVAMGLEALRTAARERQLDLTKSRLGVVGAGGNICSTYLRIMAEEIPELVLIGRQQSAARLEKIAMQLYQDAWERICTMPCEQLSGLAKAIYETQSVQQLLARQPEVGAAGNWLFEQLRLEFDGHRFIRWTADLNAIAECEVVVTASNSASPIIFAEHLANGPQILCDISVPADVAPDVAQLRPDVLVLRGGIVRLPDNPEFALLEDPLPPGHMYACMAETTLLGLERYSQHFSFGEVTEVDVRWILEIGRKHGYQLGYLKTERTF